MRRLQFFIFLVLLCDGVFSQVLSDSIIFDETEFGLTFYYQNEQVKASEVSALLEPDFDIYDLYETGREAHIFGSVFATIGTGLVAIPFITTLLGEKTNWAFTLAGTGFIGISIPLFRSYHKKTRSAIEQYNKNLKPPALNPDESGLRIGVSNTGVGLVWRF
ncbi:MAG: hypothetical protein AB7E36_14770 [Salinivirgaceae bacterium]